MEQAGTVQPEYGSARSSRFWTTLLRFQSYFGLIAILILSTLVSPMRDGRNIFLDPNNLLNIVRFASENGIIAIGMTLVILTGGIDLSVGAVLALCAVGAASFMMRAGLGTLPTVVLVLSIGALVGMANGLVTTSARLNVVATPTRPSGSVMSVTDISGINRLSRRILTNAARAVSGMTSDSVALWCRWRMKL